MKTLAIYFTQDSAVEIKFDDTILTMYHAQKAIEDRILNAEDPAEEEAKIEAEAEAALAKLKALSESIDALNRSSASNSVIQFMVDNCKNRHTLAELEELTADEVPDDKEKNSH